MQADKEKVTRLLKTAKGQIEGILKMVDDDRYCIDISNQILATEAILRKTNREVLIAHMKSCVKSAILDGNEESKLDELMDLLEKMK